MKKLILLSALMASCFAYAIRDPQGYEYPRHHEEAKKEKKHHRKHKHKHAMSQGYEYPQAVEEEEESKQGSMPESEEVGS